MSTFRLRLATPERVLFEHDVESVTLPTVDGEITVLPGHESLVAVLKAGEMVVREYGKEIPLAVAGGFIEIGDHGVHILADAAERVEEIDVAKAEEARKLAEEQKAKTADEVEFAGLAGRIEHELARLKVARKYRHRGHHGEHTGTLAE